MKHIDKFAPSILSSNIAKADDVVSDLMRAGAKIIHFDVMDGQFVPPITFGSELIRWLNKDNGVVFEAHLMTRTPEKQFELFRKAGCDRIIFHAEATEHAYRLAQEIRQLGASPGIAINPGTPIEVVVDVLNIVDLVLVMTVNPGWGGQDFISDCLPKIRRLNELSKSINPKLLIEVDGGIDPSTIGQCANEGADLFVVGSYLTKENSFEKAFEQLVSSLN